MEDCICVLPQVITSAAQAQTPNTVIAGPYGVPRLVRTEGGQWSEPIQVFSNANEIVYVPDIATSGWAQWHKQEFKDHGTYSTYVYTYLRKQRATVQDLTYVNTQTQKVLVERFLKPPLRIDLRTCTPAVSKTIANITKIAQDSIAHFNGPSTEAVITAQKYVVAKMAACASGDPDCNLSDADFAKKHPIYAPH